MFSFRVFSFSTFRDFSLSRFFEGTASALNVKAKNKLESELSVPRLIRLLAVQVTAPPLVNLPSETLRAEYGVEECSSTPCYRLKAESLATTH